MLNRHHHTPRIFRLTSSVGTCGTNTPDEVKAVQQLIDNAGYQLATGQTLAINGRCDKTTTEAIRWYQRLLNMSPNGLIQPTDTWFIQALNEANAPHWRPKHSGGPLRVQQGQITFDAEGVDYITAVAPFRQKRYPNFSRILQWPPTNSSGVTLGRGYDMGNRSSGEIFTTLRQAGIEEYKAAICSKAAHLKGRQAEQFVKVYGPLVGEITHEQQIRLFELAYQVKLNEARNLYGRISHTIPDAPAWEQLDQKIRDVIIDIFYQGVHNARALFQAAIEGKNALIAHIRNTPTYMSFESHRNRIRYLQ
ncbi:peptidoglycan-binding protein [Gibbsiella quercinecans]|uniref:peptidoglycan-binding protein n=1 Tax=Gibbsiella quercinecans TaxID=929813 RepID=UPI00242F843E|nr:peptidoglycan-binding protein [Gibbsiella quercinecans]